MNIFESALNLLKKLYTRLHTVQIKRKVTGLLLAVTLATSLGSCSTPPDDTTIVNPSDDEKENQNNETNQTQTQREIDWSKHSQLLKDLCLNEDYDKLIAQAKQIPNFVKSNSGYYEPHPYAFLEDEGFDVEAIMKDEIEAHTFSFITEDKPNSLFISTRVLQDNSYWVSYLLEYNLTDKELDDYNSLHKGTGTYFIQAVFLNNEISATRDPVSVDVTKISTDVYTNLNNQFNQNKLVGTNTCKFVISNFNVENYTFDVVVVPILCEERSSINKSTIHKGVYLTGGIKRQNYVFLSIITPILSDAKNYSGTTYLIEDAELQTYYCKDFEDKQ